MKSDPSQNNILFFSPYWGYGDVPLWDFIPRVKKAGFDGIEINTVEMNPDEISFLFEESHRHDLKIITQVAGIVEPEFQAFRKRFLEKLQFQISFSPYLINCHTGADFYSITQNSELIQLAQELSKSSGIKIIHEIHRGRFNYSPKETANYLDSLPDLRFVADFSHWCVVSESLLENHSSVVQEAISRSAHIHCRVGHAQSPQVTDPRLPEWKNELQAHLSWWDAIVINHQKKKSTLGITTEFGPPNYMPTTPFTLQPLASQWEINLYMKDFLKNRYKKN